MPLAIFYESQTSFLQIISCSKYLCPTVRSSQGPPMPLPMIYDETLAGVRNREVKPRKLTLDEEQTMYEDDLMAQYRNAAAPIKSSGGGGDDDAKFLKPALLPPKSAQPEAASQVSINR